MKMTENEINPEIPNCKDFLSKIGPIDDLLGSVSYNEIDNIDGKTQQIRTSARVFKKMKFDLSQNATSDKKERKEEIKVEEVKPEVKKTANPLWSSEEKKIFFEGLREFGKDFESIHAYLCTRLKKQGLLDEQLKSKHQIRHYYYKTFHLLCGSLKFNEKIPKNVQELYTLINYGEMRKKGGSIGKKYVPKLGELIAKGCIPIKLKGKTIKVKTPMCRALRRLNQLDEKYDDLKLPTRVLIELKPKDMVTFLQIQSIAQNPRIKVALSLQKRLSSLITCLNTRWKTIEAVVYDKAVISTNPVTKDCEPDQNVIDDNCKLLNPLLRLSPSPEVQVELPSIDISEYFTGQSISLNSFEMRKGVRTQEEEPDKQTEKTLPKHSIEEQNNRTGTSVNKVINDTVNTLLALQDTTQNPQIDNKCESKIEVKSNLKSLSLEEKLLKIEHIRKGWNVENCGTLTIGELYLMFGSDSKLVLEYSWDPLKAKEDEEVQVKPENDLAASLKKLLSLAKLDCIKKTTPPKCTCGHVCGGKNQTQFKKPLTTKVIKKQSISQETTPASDKVEESKSEDTTQTESQLRDEESTRDRQFLQSTNSVVQSMSRLNSKNRGRARGRFGQLVVERKLVPNRSENKHQIVTVNIISQDNPTREESNGGEIQENDLPSLLTERNNKDCNSEKSFSGLLESNPNSNMSTGISKILKENENQSLSFDVGDYSLSSLLGHLDCTTKENDDTRIALSQDVDSQLRTMLMETSIDYTEKFADLLAAQVSDKK